MNTRPPASAAPVDELVERLLEMCVDWNDEPIADDSTPRYEPSCRDIRQAADQLTVYARRVAELEGLLKRYRTETPLGHQPHMIAHEVDAALTGEKG